MRLRPVLSFVDTETLFLCWSRKITIYYLSSDRFHDDINVLALGADDIDIEMAFLCAQAFLESPFDDCEKRRRRIEKIS